MIRLSKIALLLVAVVFSEALVLAAGDEPTPRTMPAQLSQKRDGLGNVLAKLQGQEPVRIAYLGGSITAAPGWRVKTTEWFKHQFPSAKIEEIHAAIGGTGSDLGVFRLEHDVLRFKPDLMFVEFAVNDGSAPPKRIWQAMEGIVRQTWLANPRTDICFVYTFRTGYEEALGKAECPAAAAAMEQLAQHYGVPSVNVAVKIVDLERTGKLIYKSDSEPSAGIIRFSTDGVHPLDEAHQIYADVVTAAIQSWAGEPPIDHAARLSTPFVADHWASARMVPLRPAMLAGNWQELSAEKGLGKQFANRMGVLWEGSTPGSTLTFKFRGSQARLYDLLGPDAGQVVVTIDGRAASKPTPRFDSYCVNHRAATLALADGLDPNMVHTITVEIHPEQPDRSSVAFRLKDPENELKQPKYQGTKVRASHVLLLGEIVE